jgi:hypothetical protein
MEMSQSNLRPYKLKHKPTGLYFQPCKYGGSHLSKKGKIYQTNSNGVETGNRGYKTFRINCIKDSAIHKITKSILAWRDSTYSSNILQIETNFEDWTREEI